ncbi:hypothetical protein RO3G_15059 [Rhizopus delemar RA 99-880]|uniref:Uncharacterized protein n=1 Tax=Rhizopus delemar (strain RA 99-880 / ATCC MYA-4621 / FGSC 9543 / NRRL 43880) TaxID=246409 RepID=I1CPG8_RHIO9|nr:hypothetical protein RO3G_15059 [Rhizopus delemar RA 99-880]|eukprot:EIE90348.1 hypothetical protein RO3G_15059 [Rhizopus delemar RA 99-880]
MTELYLNTVVLGGVDHTSDHSFRSRQRSVFGSYNEKSRSERWIRSWQAIIVENRMAILERVVYNKIIKQNGISFELQPS